MPKNVVISLVDALRYDGIGALKEKNGTLGGLGVYSMLDTPNMDRIVENGSRIPNLHTTYSSTPTAVASLLTGKYPREHYAYDYHRPLHPDIKTLPEYFSDNGYHTLIFNGHFFFGKMGIGEHFDEIRKGPAKHFVQRIKELNNQGENVFAYYHTMDVHPPYLISSYPPDLSYNDTAIEVANTILKKCGQSPEFDRGDIHCRAEGLKADYIAIPELPLWKFMTQNLIYHHERENPILEDPALELAKLYVKGINRFDKKQFSALSNFLLESEEGKNTCFLLTSDHGQIRKGGDRETFYHKCKPVEEVLKVPGIIVNGGDIDNDRKISSLVDVAPTLLSQSKFECDLDKFSGSDLNKPNKKRRYIYADHCLSVEEAKTDQPSKEREFPLEGLLVMSCVLNDNGLKYYDDESNVTEHDMDKPLDLFVKIVFAKIHMETVDGKKTKELIEEIKNKHDGNREKFVREQMQCSRREVYAQELYNWKTDPEESNNLLQKNQEKYDQKARDLRLKLIERFPNPVELNLESEEQKYGNSKSVQSQIKGLGYL